jgi:hypothetical protein
MMERKGEYKLNMRGRMKENGMVVHVKEFNGMYGGDS